MDLRRIKMQSYNENELVSTKRGNLDELKNEIEDLDGKATHHVIGLIPKKGDHITINGLQYKVVAADPIKGTVRAKILKPKGR